VVERNWPKAGATAYRIVDMYPRNKSARFAPPALVLGLRVLPVEFHGRVEELATVVVVAVATDVGAHSKRVLAADDGDVVHPLKRGVLVGIRVGAAAPCAGGPEVCHRWNAPGCRYRRRHIRDIQLAQHIPFER
jgi:hypothetical protein